MPGSDPILAHARSRDGTPIAHWRSGRGPALVLVHGATADHTRWETVLPLLEPHVTVHAVDRRGRGASGDTADYRTEREAADVAAVVDAVADESGGPVDVLGHSYGAICALEATLLTRAMRRLVLYEAGVGVLTPSGLADRLAALLADGRRANVVSSLLEYVGVNPEQLATMRRLPSWDNRVAAAHMVVREVRGHDGYRFDPARFGGLRAPVLLLAGGDSPPEETASTTMLAAALPGARVVTMAGQAHIAMLTAPELFVREVLAFLDVDVDAVVTR